MWPTWRTVAEVGWPPGRGGSRWAFQAPRGTSSSPPPHGSISSSSFTPFFCPHAPKSKMIGTFLEINYLEFSEPWQLQAIYMYNSSYSWTVQSKSLCSWTAHSYMYVWFMILLYLLGLWTVHRCRWCSFFSFLCYWTVHSYEWCSLFSFYVIEHWTVHSFTNGVHFSPFVLLNSPHQLRTVTEILENINNVLRSCTQRMTWCLFCRFCKMTNTFTQCTLLHTLHQLW